MCWWPRTGSGRYGPSPRTVKVATVEAGEVQVEVALDLVGVLLAPVAEVYGEVAMSSSSVTPASEG